MGAGLAICVFLLTLLSYTLSNPAGGPLDCRKFVFAPVCRGVAAKRSHSLQIPNNFFIDANNLKTILRSYNSAHRMEWPSEDIDNDNANISRRQQRLPDETNPEGPRNPSSDYD